MINLYLEVDRVMYDVSENKEICSNSTECSFELKFLGRESVVVEMKDPEMSPLTDLDSFEMEAVCKPRVAVYMVFILLVPFIILLFAFQ